MKDEPKKSMINGYYDRFDQLSKAFFNNSENVAKLNKCIELLSSTSGNGSTIYVIGNGGSAAVAEHTAIDLTKNAGLKALAISGSPMLTTFANDYGYENIFRKYIERFVKEDDILIAISSGGTSANIINACQEARGKGATVIALSGFDGGNPLRKLADIDLWVDSEAFGYLETLHGLILHSMTDSIIGSEVYMIR